MTNSKTGSSADAAREMLCHELAGCLHAGSHTLRIRMITSGTGPTGAWFYSHGPNGWQKRSEPLTDGTVLRALDETLGMLLSNAHGDEWSAHRHTHADGYAADIRLHSDKLKDRSGAGLESVLCGLLFRDQHASKKDSRRSIRTPRPRTSRR